MFFPIFFMSLLMYKISYILKTSIRYLKSGWSDDYFFSSFSPQVLICVCVSKWFRVFGQNRRTMKTHLCDLSALLPVIPLKFFTWFQISTQKSTKYCLESGNFFCGLAWCFKRIFYFNRCCKYNKTIAVLVFALIF